MTAQLNRSRVVRGVYVVAGVASLLLGLIGLFLPVMPTTVFVLIAAFFFARSSERLHSWIVGHGVFGPLVSDFQSGLGIPLYAKVWATVAIMAGFGTSMALFVANLGARMVMTATAVLIIWYVLSRPTKKPASAEAGFSSNGI
jgi:uncharacterized membrane protein YbaN (DUF454 family)